VKLVWILKDRDDKSEAWVKGFVDLEEAELGGRRKEPAFKPEVLKLSFRLALFGKKLDISSQHDSGPFTEQLQDWIEMSGIA